MWKRKMKAWFLRGIAAAIGVKKVFFIRRFDIQE